MSQPALCWIKVCYVDKHVFLPFLASYRLAICYSPVVNERGGGFEGYKYRFKFGDHSLLLCFGVSLREIVFKLVGRPVGKTATSIPRGATQIPR